MRVVADLLRCRTAFFVLLCGALIGSCFDSHDPVDESDPVIAANQALSVPANFVDQVLVTGFNDGTAMAMAPDGRIFICQQGGALRVFKNGALLATPFVTVPTTADGERGLLGVAFDPNFSSNQFVYVYYTASSPTHNRVIRYRAQGDVAAAGSATTILDLDNLSSATNHNGGALNFGPDGKLYIGVGENGNGANAQSLSTVLGKILRINADGTIPSDNPFFASTSGNNRAIWAYGLRNPFTFVFQPGGTRMFINDVGENTWEEINDGIAGSNYGWPTTEGPTTDSRFRAPIFAYQHGSGATQGCSIAGGIFYNPSTVQFPSSYVGKYFFADYCTSWIRVFDPATGTASAFATNGGQPVGLLLAPDGSLYYLARNFNALGRITYTGSGGQAPSISVQPQPRTVAVGQSASFSVTASGTQPLSYRWQRGNADIAAATSSSYAFTAAAADNGATFRVIVSNSLGSVTSNNATLMVTSNRPPVPTISSPASGATYAAGDTINYAGTASDPEDGTLPASAFTWEVVLHHDTHTHPVVPPTSGARSGSFVIPRVGHTETNLFYRIHLTVRDAGGLTTEVTRDVVPRLSSITLQTNPAGLQLTLDGTPVTTPLTVSGVVGVTRALGAVSPQTSGGQGYQFVSWSDGGASTHSIDTPATATTYTANFNTGGGSVSNGLKAEYFDTATLTTLKVTRTDANVNFNWGTGSPDPTIAAETFSVRWTGFVTPRFSQAHTFITSSDDGVRLWINDVQIINNWTDHANTQNSGTTAVLTAGQAYPIRLEFYERSGDALITLSWQSTSQAREIVPSAQLTTTTTAPPPPPPPPPAGSELTQQGQIIAKVLNPQGGGNHNPEIIRDGVKPAPGANNWNAQYDTFTGVTSSEDWIGYQYTQSYSFGRVVFQEGMQFSDGGWFDNLTVQVRQSGVWANVSGLTVTPSYARNNGVSYETYTLAFSAITGDAIRIYGAPGGSADFISVAELQVFAAP